MVELDGDRYTIEVAPSPDSDEASRGVVGTGAVGSRHLAWWRLFRYEVRCWRGGVIPDLVDAVGEPRRLTSDPWVARRLLDLVATVPNPVWGRDELEAGEMWNSNSVVAWLIASAGLPTDLLRPPPRGRAPGWFAGLEVAGRGGPHADEGKAPSGRRRDRVGDGAANGNLETCCSTPRRSENVCGFGSQSFMAPATALSLSSVRITPRVYLPERRA